MEKNPLQILIGRQLGSVVFVQDYVQLVFDGPTITAIVDPTVRLQGKTYTSSDAGWRDALCSCITMLVTSAAAEENDSIQIRFNNGAEISISLRAEDLVGENPESAIFHGDAQTNVLVVWRPGDAPFTAGDTIGI